MRNKQTTRIRIPAPKPRNPFVAAALARPAGSHDKPRKAQRQQARQRFQRTLPGLLDDKRAEFDSE